MESNVYNGSHTVTQLRGPCRTDRAGNTPHSLGSGPQERSQTDMHVHAAGYLGHCMSRREHAPRAIRVGIM